MASLAQAYHWLVEEREVLHGSQGVRSPGNIIKHHPSLPSKPVCLQTDHVNYFTKLRKDRVETLLEVCKHKRYAECEAWLAGCLISKPAAVYLLF